MPLFTIIVPLYEKYQKYYKELVDNIINQTCTDYECVMVYKEMCFEKIIDTKFKYIQTNTDDVTCKRNIGIENAKGDYIIFCDADDCLSTSLLSTYKTLINLYNPDYICPLVVRDIKELDENESTFLDLEYINNKKTLNDYIFGRYLKCSPVKKHPFIFSLTNGKLFKRETITKNSLHFLEPAFRSEDMVFGNDYMLHAQSMVLLYKNLYLWRMNTNSVMFDAHSFFTNVNPFIDYFTYQMSKVDKKYSADLNFYLSKIIISTIHNLYQSYLTKKMNKVDFKEKLNSIINKKSSSYKVLKEKTQLSGFRKIYRWFIITHRLGFIRIIEMIYAILKT